MAYCIGICFGPMQLTRQRFLRSVILRLHGNSVYSSRFNGWWGNKLSQNFEAANRYADCLEVRAIGNSCVPTATTTRITVPLSDLGNMPVRYGQTVPRMCVLERALQPPRMFLVPFTNYFVPGTVFWRCTFVLNATEYCSCEDRHRGSVTKKHMVDAVFSCGKYFADFNCCSGSASLSSRRSNNSLRGVKVSGVWRGVVYDFGTYRQRLQSSIQRWARKQCCLHDYRCTRCSRTFSCNLERLLNLG